MHFCKNARLITLTPVKLRLCKCNRKKAERDFLFNTRYVYLKAVITDCPHKSGSEECLKKSDYTQVTLTEGALTDFVEVNITEAALS